MNVRARTLPLAFASLLCATSASAHTRSESYSRWQIERDGLVATFTVPAREASRLHATPSALPEEIERHVSARTPQGPCLAQGPPVMLASAADYRRAEWRLRCPGDRISTLVIRSTLFNERVTSHLHYASVSFADRTEQAIYADDAPEHRFGEGAGTADAAPLPTRFVALGIGHILGGYDHLAFLVALVLLASRLARLAWLITGFTLGHTAALALAVAGVLQPRTTLVEALIGFTIAATAAKALLAPGDRRSGALATLALLGLAIGSALEGLPQAAYAAAGLALFSGCFFTDADADAAEGRLPLALLMTAAFGLVHGLGFAGALTPLALPRETLGWTVAAFNLGVELGQLALVALLWLAIRSLGDRVGEAARNRTRLATGLTLCALGTFWFVARWPPA